MGISSISSLISGYQGSSSSNQGSQSTTQTVCQKEGNYYCTYSVDSETGEKTLLFKTEAPSSESENNSKNSTNSNKSDSIDMSNYNLLAVSFSNFDYSKFQSANTNSIESQLKELINTLKEL